MQVSNPPKLRTVKEYTIEIAGITMRATALDESFDLIVSPYHEHFISSCNTPEINILFKYEPWPEMDGYGELIYDTNGVWRMFEREDKRIITFNSPIFGPEPYRLAIFNEELNEGTVYVKPEERYLSSLAESSKPAFFPYEFPLDELLIISKLVTGYGLDIHGCCVDLNGRGLLFAGYSGAGKSTTANLWKERPVGILSDERIIITCDDGNPRAHGTPWPSTAEAILNTSVPLAGIFLLKHSPENELRQLPKIEALSRLFANCFQAIYFKDAVAKTMAIMDEVVSKVPVYEFGFKPDQSAIDHLIKEIGG
jgi:hypothetical protein